MKAKTYILTLSTRFPKGHPREGEETNFAGKALAAPQMEMRPVFAPCKLHTIRANYELWKHRIDEVNAGRAVLSVREWLGAPRRSKQRELFRLDRDSGIGVEMLELDRWFDLPSICGDEYGRKMYTVGRPLDDRNIRATAVRDSELAENDGLSLEDWEAWLRGCDRSQPMAVIHFTNFRYCK